MEVRGSIGAEEIREELTHLTVRNCSISVIGILTA
jgi:hypothetical protein